MSERIVLGGPSVANSQCCGVPMKEGIMGLLQRACTEWALVKGQGYTCYETKSFATKYGAALAYDSLCMEHELPLRRNTPERLPALMYETKNSELLYGATRPRGCQRWGIWGWKIKGGRCRVREFWWHHD